MWQATAETITGMPRGCEALAQPRYEVIPIRGVMDETRRLPRGATVTVTCSPKHGIDATLEVAEGLAAEGYDAVPHVAARLVRDRGDLRRIVDRIHAAGLHEVFVVGGDAAEPVGPYPGGLELLRAMADSGNRPRRIGVPAYPEPHASIPSPDLAAAFRAKNDLADYAVTQICFEARTVLDWLSREQEAGLRLPVYLGLPGVIDRKRLMGLAVRIGLGASTRVLRRQAGLASRLLGGSTYRPDDLAEELVPAFDGPQGRHLAGFHINTFNQVDASLNWVNHVTADLCRRYAEPTESPAMAGAVAQEYSV
ncbi:methylenetetrahydrofolate reductase [Aquisalimonas lutea]|uniref:methylenetetrahydrofolate reductase n=1 Tax=Aquisalimonas lutea TaxID=1327750 RepID=UPI0025B592F4|nr:methylenetetrahydrofolate reductase [Aquisalimonas lutea]MDN3517335.1 methylenetetrahydrofolate reductase [Aquisalimonas lutea]